MFSRSTTTPPLKTGADIKTLEAMRPAAGPVPASEMRAPAPPPLSATMPQHTVQQTSMSSFSARSIIGNDLMIVGQGLRIITKGTLQVDGRVDGDVIGSEVIIGERGHVTGVVSGENVLVRGHVHGTIKGLKVALEASAHVEGDVHHHSLTVEQGAHLDGRVRRPQDIAELKPDLDAMAEAPAPAADAA